MLLTLEVSQTYKLPTWTVLFSRIFLMIPLNLLTKPIRIIRIERFSNQKRTIDSSNREPKNKLI